MKTESMIRIFILAVALCCLAAVNIAIAKEAQVSLKVSNMTCAACPFIVKQSLTRVDGVTDVNVSYRNKAARVIFDDQITSVSALIKATAGVGFPSKLQE